jgi:transcription termination/antitermination protein NusG
MLVQMEYNNETYHIVKNTPKVTGFVGGGDNAPPQIPDEEVDRITNQVLEGAETPKPLLEFEKNEQVRVVDGPFAGFNGMVDEVRPEKGKLRVMVSIFGRSTPVELDFTQVEKT